jgi:hypothetical protein
MITPTIAPKTTPPMLDPTTTETARPDFTAGVSEGRERQAVEVPGPPPLCKGPLDHARPFESVREMKKGDAQERETVQFMGLISYDMILYGGWRAGPISIVNGGVPFWGVREMSVHWFIHPYWEMGPLSTRAVTPRVWEGKVKFPHPVVPVVVAGDGYTV